MKLCMAAAEVMMVETSSTPEMAPPPAREMSSIELTRRIAFMLTSMAEKLGVQYDELSYEFEDLARQIVVAAQSGRRLSPGDYRAAWTIWSVLRCADDGRR